jgi:hypothetical protein
LATAFMPFRSGPSGKPPDRFSGEAPKRDDRSTFSRTPRPLASLPVKRFFLQTFPG